MTKEMRSRLRKDKKKYETLAEYSSEEDQETYMEVAEFLEKMLEK